MEKSKKILAWLFTSSFLLSILSCATGENFSSVEEGMTKSQVREILGKEDQIDKKNGWTIFYYKNRMMSGWSWDKTDYHVVFDPDGRVYVYGHGPVDTRTSERMARWSIEQQKMNQPKKSIRCNTSQYGNLGHMDCTEY